MNNVIIFLWNTIIIPYRILSWVVWVMKVVFFTFYNLSHWKWAHKKQFLYNIFILQPRLARKNKWLLFLKYLRSFRITLPVRTVLSFFKYYCIKITKTIKNMFLWYNEYRYTIVQKIIYISCWVIWFGGFTYDFHDNIQLFVPFVEAYLTNSFIYNIGVYSFKIKNITKFQAFRGFLFVCFWHYVDYQVCLPILKWIVYVLDKKVDYESMGWVYKLEAYLDAKGWIPRHPWSTYTKKKNIRRWDFFLDQQRLDRVQRVRDWDKMHENLFFGLGKWLDWKAKSRDAFPKEFRDNYNKDIREHHQFVYQEKLFSQGMDIIDAKQKAKKAFQNDKTDYWEEEVNATRIRPKNAYTPKPLTKRDAPLEIQRLIERHEEDKWRFNPDNPDYLENIINEISAAQQSNTNFNKNNKSNGKWRTKKQQKRYEMMKQMDEMDEYRRNKHIY